jgi:hypothetical protein
MIISILKIVLSAVVPLVSIEVNARSLAALVLRVRAAGSTP